MIPAAILISLVIIGVATAFGMVLFQNMLQKGRIETLESELEEVIQHLIKNDGASLQLKTRTRR